MKHHDGPQVRQITRVPHRSATFVRACSSPQTSQGRFNSWEESGGIQVSLCVDGEGPQSGPVGLCAQDFLCPAFGAGFRGPFPARTRHRLACVDVEPGCKACRGALVDDHDLAVVTDFILCHSIAPVCSVSPAFCADCEQLPTMGSSVPPLDSEA